MAEARDVRADQARAGLAEVLRRLVEAYAPWRVYLFGSVARGDCGPDSDFDLLVIVPDDAPQRQRSALLAYKVLRGTGLAVDVLVCRRRHFEERLQLPASFPATVVREGKLLYGA